MMSRLVKLEVACQARAWAVCILWTVQCWCHGDFPAQTAISLRMGF